MIYDRHVVRNKSFTFDFRIDRETFVSRTSTTILPRCRFIFGLFCRSGRIIHAGTKPMNIYRTLINDRFVRAYSTDTLTFCRIIKKPLTENRF